MATEESSSTDRRTVTKYHIGKDSTGEHAVQLVTVHDPEARSLISYAERIRIEHHPAYKVTHHDPDLYVTINMVACRKFSRRALSEAHGSAIDEVTYHRDAGNPKILALFAPLPIIEVRGE